VRINNRSSLLAALMASVVLILSLASARLHAQTTCDGSNPPPLIPFTDVTGSSIFCRSIAAAFFSGISSGTSATTYTPLANVTREQMAAFVTRTLDQSLRRGSQRAALGQFWVTSPQYDKNLGTYPVGTGSKHIRSDGEFIWVANAGTGDVCAARASTGEMLGLWTGAATAAVPLVAMGRVFVTGSTNPGTLYMLDPSQPPEPVTTISSALGNTPVGIAFDGAKIWTANSGGSVSIITASTTLPWPVNTVSAGFTSPVGILFDGANMWVTDTGDGKLKKLNSDGSVALMVTVGTSPRHPVYDGTNIWVPNNGSNTVSVIRASSGAVIATLTGNGLSGPMTAAFDGERVLVTNNAASSVSLWKAADLTAIGTFLTGGAMDQPGGACSDGVQFWITLDGVDKLARF
jgi:YVTN family beta-propeller protein